MRAPEFWTNRGLANGVLAAMLSPIGVLYGLSVRLKQAQTRPFRAKARVVCVGNLTAGGTGKTPTALAIARMMTARRARVIFLARGYGGRLAGPVEVDLSRHAAGDVGDEPLLLAAHAPTIVARDRREGARLADHLGADIIVMDDGFQNFGLEKDLSLVVIDAAAGFGNGRLIPAGPLRERVSDGLARADAVVLMGQGNPALPPFAGPVLRAHLVPSAPEMLAGQRVVAFAGIGRPDKFFGMLRMAGSEIVNAQSLADHHRFRAAELSALKATAQASGARLVTTQKDYVRIDVPLRDGIMPVPVHAVFDDEAALAGLLDRAPERANVEAS